MLSSAGVDRLLTMDLHSDQIQGSSIFRWTTFMPADFAVRRVEEQLPQFNRGFAGRGRCGTRRALAKQLDADLAIIDKRRPKRMWRR